MIRVLVYKNPYSLEQKDINIEQNLGSFMAHNSHKEVIALALKNRQYAIIGNKNAKAVCNVYCLPGIDTILYGDIYFVRLIDHRFISLDDIDINLIYGNLIPN